MYGMAHNTEDWGVGAWVTGWCTPWVMHISRTGTCEICECVGALALHVWIATQTHHIPTKKTLLFSVLIDCLLGNESWQDRRQLIVKSGTNNKFILPRNANIVFLHVRNYSFNLYELCN